MERLFAVAVAAAGLVAVAYVYHRLPIQVRSRGQVWLVRGLLAAVGVAMGALLAARWGGHAHAWVAFLAGFGLVHVPAAIILLIKKQRHEYG